MFRSLHRFLPELAQKRPVLGSFSSEHSVVSEGSMVSFGSFQDEETCLNCGHLSSGLAHCRFSSLCYTFKEK